MISLLETVPYLAGLGPDRGHVRVLKQIADGK